MLVREFTEQDLSTLRKIHAAQGFDYAFPDLSNPLFFRKLVLTDGAAEREDESPRLLASSDSAAHTVEEAIVGAAFLRLTAEAYLLLDPKAGTPRQRWNWLLALHATTERDALQHGLEDVHAWLPPPIAARFGKRIERLGWVRDDAWRPYCKQLSDIAPTFSK